MNMSTLITRIKRRLGIYGIDLPVDTNKLFTEVIQDSTIPVFSMYQPVYEYLHINTDTLERVRNGCTVEEYLLPDMQYREIVLVAHVEYDTDMYNGDYMGLNVTGMYQYNPFSTYSMYQSIALSNAQSQLYGKTYPSLRFDFYPPRRLVLYNKILSNSLKILVGFKHDISLASITPTLSESFYNLALYDCMDAAYQIAKHWDAIETSIGSIKLNIDEWSNAYENRKQLLEEWDNSYHLDFPVQEVSG